MPVAAVPSEQMHVLKEHAFSELRSYPGRHDVQMFVLCVVQSVPVAWFPLLQEHTFWVHLSGLVEVSAKKPVPQLVLETQLLFLRK